MTSCWASAFALWTIILWSHAGGEDRPRVVGSPEPITAALGGDCVLPCRVEPQLNVEGLEVSWWRPDIPPDPTDPLSEYRYVHCYRHSHNAEDRKMPAYAGRTAMFPEHLKHGNISLKIRNLKLSDQGRYRCQVPELGSATLIRLFVEPKLVQTTETPLHPERPGTPGPKEEDVLGEGFGWFHLLLLLMCLVLLILVGGVGGCVFKSKCQQTNVSGYQVPPDQAQTGTPDQR